MEITYKELPECKYNLAPSQLSIYDIHNKNTLFIKDLIDRKLKFSDKGTEIGSINYISKSSHFFIKTKALQPDYFIPTIDTETVNPIRPQIFKNFNLKENDLIISKDSNIGEAIILDKDYPNYTLSGALYKLPITINKFYLFAFLKHNYFRKQLDLLVPKGSTIRHAKTLFLECKIPFPNQENKDDVIKYIELLTQAIINREKEIRKKNLKIYNLLFNELIDNQKNVVFNYENPTFFKLQSLNRMNAGIYSEYFCQQEFMIRNYKNGFENIKNLGFKVNRGQNLQVSCIGRSIYTDKPKENFYSVIKPMHISIYGTPITQEYLGNPNKLKTLKAGDIIFGAEGFQKGRSLVILKDRDNTITNIHGIIINHEKGDINLSIFIKCFLDFLRSLGLIDLYAVGGNGGSLAKKYWDVIPIPLFPEPKQKEIILLYHNIEVYPQDIDLSNFLIKDKQWIEKAGIIELDKSTKEMKESLNIILNKIVNNESVDIDFSFKDSNFSF